MNRRAFMQACGVMAAGAALPLVLAQSSRRVVRHTVGNGCEFKSFRAFQDAYPCGPEEDRNFIKHKRSIVVELSDSYGDVVSISNWMANPDFSLTVYQSGKLIAHVGDGIECNSWSVTVSTCTVVDITNERFCRGSAGSARYCVLVGKGAEEGSVTQVQNDGVGYCNSLVHSR